MDEDGTAYYNPRDLAIGCLALPLAAALVVGGIVGLVLLIDLLTT